MLKQIRKCHRWALYANPCTTRHDTLCCASYSNHCQIKNQSNPNVLPKRAPLDPEPHLFALPPPLFPRSAPRSFSSRQKNVTSFLLFFSSEISPERQKSFQKASLVAIVSTHPYLLGFTRNVIKFKIELVGIYYYYYTQNTREAE